MKSICKTAVCHWRSLQSHQQAGCEVKARSFPKLEHMKKAGLSLLSTCSLKLCNQQALVTQTTTTTTTKGWFIVFSFEKRNTVLKLLWTGFQPGLHYCIGSVVEDMTKFWEFLAEIEIMAWKQSIVKPLLTLIGSHHLYLSPYMQL